MQRKKACQVLGTWQAFDMCHAGVQTQPLRISHLFVADENDAKLMITVCE